MRINSAIFVGTLASLLTAAAAFAGADSFPAVLQLADLDGTNGFVLEGASAGDESGAYVERAGDVNGDGIEDFIIGADRAAPNGNQNAGMAYIVFGSATGSFPPLLDLETLDGTNGFAVPGLDAEGNAGFAVSGAGDVNHDGIDDFLIGAWFADNFAGEAYLVFGSDQGFPASFDLAALNGSNGFVVGAIGNSDNLGASVSDAGDVNADGIDDFLVGALGARSNIGDTYVIFGSDQGFPALFDPATLDGSNGFVARGISGLDFSGASVSGLGDVNGDGIDDIVIASDFADPGGRSNAGEIYVVFGRDTAFPASLPLSLLNGNNGFRLDGIDSQDRAGFCVSDAGDVNADGINDVLIGAPTANPGGVAAAGESYVVFGSDQGFPASIPLSSLNGANGFVVNGIDVFDLSGGTVSDAGDVNGDGINDIMTGSIGDASSPGKTHVVFGSAAGFPASLDLASLDGSNGFALHGVSAGDDSGDRVAGIGDVNNDGTDDILIGAPKPVRRPARAMWCTASRSTVGRERSTRLRER